MSERRADCGAALRLLHVGILIESIFVWLLCGVRINGVAHVGFQGHGFEESVTLQRHLISLRRGQYQERADDTPVCITRLLTVRKVY
jgi:hypothetical protein